MESIKRKLTSSKVSPNSTITTAERVLCDHAAVLHRINSKLSKPIILADTYSARVKAWFLGTATELFSSLDTEDVELTVHFRRSRQPDLTIRACHAAAYMDHLVGAGIEKVSIHRKYFVGERLTHGLHNAIDILFPRFDTTSKYYEVWAPQRNYTFVQMSLAERELACLPQINFCGFKFRALPNLKTALDLNVIPPTLDLVYTWVDGRSKQWSADFSAARNERGIGTTRDATDKARFLSHSELLYSVRSALMYLRGLGKIYVVTNGQHPQFLREDLPGLEFVNHMDIFPRKESLPTFNSHAIESNLHRISGLSEKYLYMNDDMFFGRTVTPVLFFDEYGRTRYFSSENSTIPSHQITSEDFGSDAAARNAQELLRKAFGVFVTRKFWHTAIAIDRRVIEAMEAQFPQAFEVTSNASLRSRTDFAISGSFYCHYAATIGKACAGTMSYRYVTLANAYLQENLAKTLGSPREADRPDMICINDIVASPIPTENDEIMSRYLNAAYPAFSPLEE
jgi:hypothetical protein